MRRVPTRFWRRPGVRLAAAAVIGAMALAACSSGGPVVVTVTTTPGANGASSGNPVTVQPLDSSTAQGSSGTQQTDQHPAKTSGPDGAAKQTSSKKKAPHTSKTTPTTTSSAPAMRVSANPKFGTKNIGPNDPITLTVFNAQLQKVTMLGDDGSMIKGTITNEKHTWTKSERLKYNTKYTVTGTAKGVDGSTKHLQGSFTTVKPKSTMAAYIQIPEGDTVGIAAPIVITFAGQVKDRAAAEKTLHVTSDGKKVNGSWGWMQDEDIQGNGVKQSRVHFRPAPRGSDPYWPANISVHVEADLYGVDLGGAWGREDITRNFKIGPALKLLTNVSEHRLLLTEDDKIVKNYPVSYGVSETQDPDRTTVSGIHVITEKKPGEFTMCNPKYDYCGVKEYWGIRINNNGEFIHANVEVEKEGLLGKENVSHGCINMSMADAKDLFDRVYYGVPVDVEDTGVPMTYADYIWDWSVSWSTWKTFSAL